MAGDLAGEEESSSMGCEDWVNKFKDLETTTQIAQVFDGICQHCKSLFQSNLVNLLNNLNNHQKTVKEESCEEDVLAIHYVENSLVPSPVIITNEQLTNHDGAPTNGDAFDFIDTNANTVQQQQLSDHDQTPIISGDDSNSKAHVKDASFFTPSPSNGQPLLRDLFGPQSSSNHGNHGSPASVANGSEEWHKFLQVKRKKNYVHYEKVNGKEINVLQGLELHTGVFSTEEQNEIVEAVYDFQRMGRERQLMARTYSEPLKWMRGKGRVTLQFGCCYNYAMDKDGNPPGIIRDEEVDPLPVVFKEMISKMVRWHVLPPTCIPNSCIVNIYDEGDCIPPHIDHHDFLRPFCTLSFLAECNILFGLNLKIAGPGEFSGPVSIPLPVGSVLVLNGNGADVAKHCVPAVPAKRISVTFRRMDESKMPYGFIPDPELLNLRPLRRPLAPNASKAVQSPQEDIEANDKLQKSDAKDTVVKSFMLQDDEFPPLGSSKSRKR